jgi:hypothetical protein
VSNVELFSSPTHVVSEAMVQKQTFLLAENNVQLIRNAAHA